MTNIAILGFGTVGGAVAQLVRENAAELKRLTGEEIRLSYILDLRDFAGTPYAPLVVHDVAPILADPEVSVVVEAMGGLHPAADFTAAALKAGKHVVTSNKEVVATVGDELLALAKENGVCYRFEAAVGGGIPLISPLLSMLRQNKPTEVRGILNGTTNYVLTRMFTYGDKFETALADAQTKGYAEKNPDADILGIDTARKTAILAAILTGKLYPVDKIHVEGITGIREEDVRAAELLGAKIRLLGRVIVGEAGDTLVVAPFLVPDELLLSDVSGVTNAAEFIGDPIGSVVLSGPGAGGGATASAVVGDLVQILVSGTKTVAPVFEKAGDPTDFAGFASRHYFAGEGLGTADLPAIFGECSPVGAGAFLTEKLTEADVAERIAKAEAKGWKMLSHIRML